MAEREKVIRGIECCLDGLCECCPYNSSDGPGGCKDKLMVDALSALKEQEPRVLERTELTSWGGVMYLEECGLYPVAAELDRLGSLYNFYVLRFDEPFEQLPSQYGKTWRCWTSRPPYEKRKEIPWND